MDVRFRFEVLALDVQQASEVVMQTRQFQGIGTERGLYQQSCLGVMEGGLVVVSGGLRKYPQRIVDPCCSERLSTFLLRECAGMEQSC